MKTSELPELPERREWAFFKCLSAHLLEPLVHFSSAFVDNFEQIWIMQSPTRRYQCKHYIIVLYVVLNIFKDPSDDGIANCELILRGV